MGLFKSLGFGKKEGGSKEVQAEAPKTEAREKSAADTGYERIAGIKKGAQELWDRFKKYASSTSDMVKNKAMDAYSAALGVVQKGSKMAVEGALNVGESLAEGANAVVGGIEKGVKATVEGGKAAVEYAKETGREAMEIKDLAVMAAKDAATRTKEAVVDAGYTGVALAFMTGEKGAAMAEAMKERGIELKSAAGKKLVEGAVALADMGLNAIEATLSYGADKIEQVIEVAKQAKAAGIDLKKRGGDFALNSLVAAFEAGISVKEAIEGVAGATLEKGREIVGMAKEKMDALRGRAREAKDGFFARLTAARDRFSSRLKQAVIESLRPEIDNLIRQKAEELLRDREALSAGPIEIAETDLEEIPESAAK
ncbi:hypothetical protein HY626_01475 [Candidatus Uhrbacteria bacterium]|nr:hypothetical protein [Candidatus Uhrbacteria bacterium]